MACDRTSARKVMVVAEPTRESAGALKYALYNAVLEKDELILLHVENPSSWLNILSSMFVRKPFTGSSTTTTPEREAAAAAGEEDEVDFLEEMKSACKIAQPKLSVRTVRVVMDGKDKATIILSLTKEQGIDLIIVGQRRSLSSAILGSMRPAGPTKGAKPVDTAEYLIENSPCTCVGVHKKGQNAGYVLNTKSQKNFWLLA